jgi:hypothetical protein
MKTIKDIEYSFNHTRERLNERYNISLNRSEYDRLCGIITDGICMMVENDDQEIYETYFKGSHIRVVWSTKRNCITTVLPKG